MNDSIFSADENTSGCLSYADDLPALADGSMDDAEPSARELTLYVLDDPLERWTREYVGDNERRGPVRRGLLPPAPVEQLATWLASVPAIDVRSIDGPQRESLGGLVDALMRFERASDDDTEAMLVLTRAQVALMRGHLLPELERLGRGEEALRDLDETATRLQRDGKGKAMASLMDRRSWSRGRGRGLRTDWKEVLTDYLLQLARGVDPFVALQRTEREFGFPTTEAAEKWLQRRRDEERHLELWRQPLIRLRFGCEAGTERLPEFRIPNAHRKTPPASS